MKKTLVLIDSLFYQYNLDGKEKRDVLFLPMMKNEINNKIVRAVRKAHLSSFLCLKEIWMYKWLKIIDKYQVVILADTGNAYNIAKYIRHKWRDKRIIIWYRNSVSAAVIKPENIDRKVCELWSFDKEDCMRYNMDYNPQFYMRNGKYVEKKIEYDAFFVGQDKGRLKLLNDIESKLNENGLKSKFCIVGVNSDRLSYNEVIDYISQSKVIIDCQCDWQEGITLRPLESIFYCKKLITNNPDIISTSYYNRNNIFIWGKDDINELSNWFQTDFEPISRDIIDEYDLYGWIRRFG